MAIFVQFIFSSLIAVIISLYFLCRVNEAVRFHVKNWVFNVWYMVLGLFVIPQALSTPGHHYNMRHFAYWTKKLRTEDIFGFHMDVKDRYHLDSKEPAVVVVNHQSALDQIAMMELLPRHGCCMTAKKSLMYAGTFGIAALLCGTIFIDRTKRTKAKTLTDQIVSVITKKKTKVWLYPEGTRSSGTGLDMLPFKKGAFHIAVAAQVPVIPVVLSNYKDCYNPKKYKFDPVNVTITVLPPISTNGLTAEDVPEFTEKIRELMLYTYKETSKVLVEDGNNKS
ncbi:1-acyl-sn-glycerol-3-phosphate acyltransferase alpha-like [Glandiceps talaboti]